MPACRLSVPLALALISAPAAAQTFQLASGQVPQGGPFNNSHSENVDFADVDLDGDFDAAFADGGDCCNDQNRLWINLGGAQGGTPGFFLDETATRFPAVLDDGRDVEFVDFDADGDADLYLSATSQISNQANRWWLNLGGAQAGSPGFFQDQTAARWVGLGGPGSSVAPSAVLGTGGFIDFACDGDFGDLDDDGDLDLVHSSYGGAFGGQSPTRLFLNDGTGHFSELNPSGFQLTGLNIQNGDPALWAEGTQQANTLNATGLQADVASSALDVDVGDVDGDHDLDLLHGARQEAPRLFQNRLAENGAPIFRDVTSVSFAPGYTSGSGHYEQELGDIDDDGDLDVYGLNWFDNFTDETLRNDGTGFFTDLATLPGSGADDNEVDFGDYDNDGDLDAYVANFSGQDKLYRNGVVPSGSFSYVNVTGSELPAVGGISLDADWSDVDGDGDYDVMTAQDAGQSNDLYLNVGQVADTHAPRLSNLEQAPDRLSSAVPTVVHVAVLDNAAYYVTWYAVVLVEFRVDGGVWYVLPMRSSAGQVFRGEIPGAMIGTVEYRVRARDRYGNETLSGTLSYVAGDGGCNGSISGYCTAKATSIPGCVPDFAFNGVPSASAKTGFTIQYGSAPGGNPGLFLYTTNGALGTPVQNAFGWLCVQPGVGLFRIGLQNGGGSPGTCSGSFGINFNQHIFGQTQNPALVAGATVDLQVWYRDPPTPGTANLSAAARFTVCP